MPPPIPINHDKSAAAPVKPVFSPHVSPCLCFERKQQSWAYGVLPSLVLRVSVCMIFFKSTLFYSKRASFRSSRFQGGCWCYYHYYQ